MADKLPLGFIDDDDKLRRNDSRRREKNMRVSTNHLLWCQCASESVPKHPQECGGGEGRIGMWTDSPTTIEF